MREEHLEKGADVQDTPEENNYQRYLDIGGIINEKDYNRALTRAKDTTTLREVLTYQAENIAKHVGIDLTRLEGSFDKRVLLYAILQEMKPKEVKDNDWSLFREVLRMLGDTDSLDKLKAVLHTNRRLKTYCPLCGRTKDSVDCP